MKRMRFSEAIDYAIGVAMAADDRVVVFGEDVPMIRRELVSRFGPHRVIGTPISESAFLGSAVGAAMSGLRPVAEVITADFLSVALSALLNEAVMVPALSGGRWRVPLVVRAGCGGGYGDAGQHEQALWGLLGGIPGLGVVVPSNPADAAGLMLAAIESDDPVVFLEHKLLSDLMRESLGGDRRETVTLDVPAAGVEGEVPRRLAPVPLGSARIVREGRDVALIGVGVGVHRAVEAAEQLVAERIRCTVIDLRTVAPLDCDTIRDVAAKTRRVVVVDEDYEAFGLSGEIAAVLAEAGIKAKFARVAVQAQIPYARHLEEAALPNTGRIETAVRRIVG